MFCSVDDLSDKKNASQSHTQPGESYHAKYAVDRNQTTCMRTINIGGNSKYNTVWWKVDLGHNYNIYSIAILFKTYDGYGMYLVFFFAYIWYHNIYCRYENNLNLFSNKDVTYGSLLNYNKYNYIKIVHGFFFVFF